VRSPLSCWPNRLRWNYRIITLSAFMLRVVTVKAGVVTRPNKTTSIEKNSLSKNDAPGNNKQSAGVVVCAVLLVACGAA
jgi:hypothetical protein